MTTPELIQLGIVHHRAGRSAEAEKIYRQVLAQDAKNSDAVHLLGLLALRSGQLPLAVELITQAIALDATISSYHLNLGVALDKLERVAEAIAAYQKSLTLNWNSPIALSNLGDALRRQGRFDEAVAACNQALKLSPSSAQAHNNLGTSLLGKRQFEAAATAFRKAIAIHPNFADAHLGLANAMHGLERYYDSASSARGAIALKPDWPEAHNTLAAAHIGSDRFEDAIAATGRALQHRPHFAEAHNNMGIAHFRLGQYDEAIAAFHAAIEQRPQFAEALNNLGNVYYNRRELDKALGAYRAALELRPDYAMAHWNVGVAQALRGDFPAAWDELEWGQVWQRNPRHPQLTQPMWDGGDLDGRRILIHAEQGFGDAIQFIRYLPRVVEQGGKIIVACQRELHRLFRGIAPIEQWIAQDEPLPPHDVRCPLMSLPRIFKISLDAIPANIPYLSADPELFARWQSRMATDSTRKIGIAWAGRPKDINDRDRSITLGHLAPLAAISGITFYSLQKGDAAKQALAPPLGMSLIDWTGELSDFADTAALIANLDLVIAVDMVVVHLAAALGKPVWLLLQWAPDWRWLLDRTDSPWYPTLRIFRQKERGDWRQPINQIVEALQ